MSLFGFGLGSTRGHMSLFGFDLGSTRDHMSRFCLGSGMNRGLICCFFNVVSVLVLLPHLNLQILFSTEHIPK